MTSEYDVIVAGGGAAGCVVAARLSEDPNCRVLLIEAGESDQGVAMISDPKRWIELGASHYDWHYTYSPTSKVLGREISIPRGRVLGGSSSTNALMWYRGHPSDYDAWHDSGAEGWNFDNLLPYFRKSEDWEHGETVFRGSGGPLRIEQPHNPHPIAQAMLDGMAELGHEVLDDLNGPSITGAALSNFNYTQAHGTTTRWSTARGYLDPALDRSNLTVITNTTVLRVIVSNGVCTGVECVVDGCPSTFRADSGVVLTLGAINTPAVLMHSGIGNGNDLARLGIPVVHDLPGVGENMQDHPLVKGMNFRAKAPLGPKTDNGGGSMMNWHSSLAGEVPDLHAFVVQGVHAGKQVAERYDLSGDIFAISPGLMRSQSIGWVRLRSSEAGAPLDIQPNYLDEPDDLHALSEGIEFIMDLAETASYRALIAEFAAPNTRLNRAEREQYVRLSCDTFFHPCGTAKMGKDDMSVVDSSLAVHGVAGLWVADASVIPVIPSCNTLAPVIAIAERFSDLFSQDRKPS